MFGLPDPATTDKVNELGVYVGALIMCLAESGVLDGEELEKQIARARQKQDQMKAEAREKMLEQFPFLRRIAEP